MASLGWGARNEFGLGSHSLKIVSRHFSFCKTKSSETGACLIDVLKLTLQTWHWSHVFVLMDL